MRGRDHHFVTNVTSLLICGLLAGIAVAAAAFPAVAMSGLAAKAGSEGFASLPSELKQATAPQLTRVFAADNKTPVAVFYDEFRSEVPLKDISVNMQNAIVAAEDHEFYTHNGVDLKGAARAMVNNSGKQNSKQGASTLTMQLVRMSLSYTATSPQEVVDATKDTPARKIAEMKYAMQIEKKLTKQQILERYLNAAPFGNGAYGVYAASQVYFRKPPKDLTIAEAALLAGMVKAPTGFDPTTTIGYPKALDRRNWVIGNMRDLGYATPQEATDAIAVKLGHTTQRTGNGCAAVKNNSWGFFCDYFYRWWLSRPEFGRNPYDRERRLKSGGYTIQSSLDIKAQAAARENIADRIGVKDRDALLLAAVQPGTGRVRALAANRRFKLDDGHNKLSSDPAKADKNIRGSYPNTTNPLLTGGGDITGYQAGSVFKMFTMVAALENGFPLAYPINTTYRYKSSYRDSPGCGGGFYCPSNASKSEKGPYNMWTGFGSSVNTYFVPLEEKVGAEKVVDVAQRFGVQFRAPNDEEMATKYAEDWGAFTLGVSASTPLDMANAYATLAGDGKYCTPTPVQQITTLTGEKLDVGKPNCRQVTKPDVARAALDAARCPVGDSAQLGGCHGSTAGGARGIVGHPIFGKTGTTDNDKTASLIVGTSSMVVAGYLVNPDYQNHPYRLSHDVVNPAVEYTLRDIMKGKARVQFKRPSGNKIAQGEQRSIPGFGCISVADAIAKVEGAGFTATPGTEVESDCPKGQAAGTEPSGRTIKNGFVSIQISKGKPGAKPGPSTPAAPR
ncbi:transglycosylase domain-containing protein [Amorphoplanes digitatis]|uniref:Membrane peptidoglycan carboxypeptidase n=1 Tax=Actinoplanes digitatis TaxID=1868 RepID=A0A7W7HSZ1_9ACTN|nr:transglycosylase domain-containing protein [Actinoplanes digitatis]MBB4760031.1 membrane peptidoglycan carboxypeptidase [Actinoplanes digitatis]GID95879.1 carboxypeptidase [Actinoplanes digitatis]